jgi:sugar-specific transcriptional regulator TrmB
VIVLIQNKTIIYLKNQNQDRIIIKNQHNLLNKIKIMLNKVKKEVIVIHGENRTIIHNNIKDLQKTKY